MENKVINATYVSIWDGSEEIRTSCKFNPETNKVSDIESADVDGLDLEILDSEYIELPGGKIVETFTTDEGRKVVDGYVED